MLQGEYVVSSRSGTGRRYGRLVLRQSGTAFWGRLSPLGDIFPAAEWLRGRMDTHGRLILGRRTQRGLRRSGEAYQFDISQEGGGAIVMRGVSVPDAARWGFDTEAELIAERAPGVFIRPSAVHGLGLKTATRRAAGQIITVVRGDLSDMQTRWSVRLASDSHCEPSGYLRFVNHSDQPNCRIERDDAGTAVLRTLQAVEPGDELCFNYIENEGELIGDFLGESAVDRDGPHTHAIPA